MAFVLAASKDRMFLFCSSLFHAIVKMVIEWKWPLYTFVDNTGSWETYYSLRGTVTVPLLYSIEKSDQLWISNHMWRNGSRGQWCPSMQVFSGSGIVTSIKDAPRLPHSACY